MLDSLDYKIINHLTKLGRMTWSELATNLKLSSPSAAERVKRLEEKGYIKGYRAILDYSKLDFNLTAYISLSLTHPKYRLTFLKETEKIREIEECHHITGDDDFLMKVRCRDTKHLDHILNEQLKTIPGIAKTKTTIVLSTAKESVVNAFEAS